MLFSIEWGLGFVPRGSVRLILWQQPVHTLFSPLVREMLHLCCCFCDKDPPCQLSAAEDYCLCSDLLLVLDKSMSASFSQNLNSFWLWSGENEKREHSWLHLKLDVLRWLYPHILTITGLLSFEAPEWCLSCISYKACSLSHLMYFVEVFSSCFCCCFYILITFLKNHRYERL